MGDPPILNIIGEQVALGPIRRDLVPLYQRWMNDFDVTRTLAIGIRPMPFEAENGWYEAASSGVLGPVFTIYEKTALEPVGVTGLHEVDQTHRTAEFGITIGSKEHWGRGFGTETARLMLEYGFVGMGLHNIMLRAYAYNPAGIRAYEKAGFQHVGRRREAHWFGGKPHDVVIMDCVASDFTPTVLAKLLP